MTRKKKDKEKMKDVSTEKDKRELTNKKDTKPMDGEIPDSSEEEAQDVKLLEGEEQKVLEYHDLDDLISKYNKLKENSNKDKELLTKYQKESESWKNKHMRLQAEFENAQKRWEKNRQNLRKEYIAYTLKSFLPLYDSFKKALEGDDKNKAILKQFYDQFVGILKFHKAEPIEVKLNDPFDYSYHEALSSLEKDDVPNNSIIEIIQDGWKMDKDVLRFAKVIISRKPAPPKPESVIELETESYEENPHKSEQDEVVSNQKDVKIEEVSNEAEQESVDSEKNDQETL